jgi:hypothetical protein
MRVPKSELFRGFNANPMPFTLYSHWLSAVYFFVGLGIVFGCGWKPFNPHPGYKFAVILSIVWLLLVAFYGIGGSYPTKKFPWKKSLLFFVLQEIVAFICVAPLLIFTRLLVWLYS